MTIWFPLKYNEILFILQRHAYTVKLKDEISGKYVEIGNYSPNLKIYVCGPTVYDKPHLGHLRTYVAYDAMVKYMRHRGRSVFYLQNITDIDDKIINRALETGQDPLALSRKYTLDYMDAMKYAGVDSVNYYAMATHHIKDIIKQIKRLEKKGFTYTLPDGVYFRVWMLKNYGRLKHQSPEEQKTGARAKVAELKEDQRDFVLWKFKKEGEPSWRSPWGEGRPGWHIEDTAISLSFFGSRFDLHGAGRDLLFPHNEAELSIMTALKNSENVCPAWSYTGMLKINGEKMSKSLNNFIPVDDVMQKYSREEVRYAFLSSLYPTDLDFSWNMLEESRKNISYIRRSYEKLEKHSQKGASVDVGSYRELLYRNMDDDFNTRIAISILMELASEIMKANSLDSESANEAKKLFDDANTFLGIIPEQKEKGIPEQSVESLLKLREILRKKKLYPESDAIREALKNAGIIMEDGGNGTEWRRE